MKIILMAILASLPCFISAQEDTLQLSEWDRIYEEVAAITEKGQYAKALPLARKSLQIAIQDSTENSLAYGTSLDLLGYVLHHTGQFLEAEKCFSKSLEVTAKLMGKSNEDYIIRLNNQAMLHLDMGSLAEATSDLEEAVRLSHTHLEPDNIYTSILVNNLGLAYEQMGNFGRALDYYEESLKLTETAFGNTHVRYANRLANIGAVYRKIGKHEQALEQSNKARQIYAKALSVEHPVYISVLSGIMTSYRQLKRYPEAVACADTIFQWLSARTNEEALSYYHHIISGLEVYRHTGMYAQCIDIGEASLKKYTEIFPKQYNIHANLSEIIFEVLDKLGRTQEASVYAKKNLEFAQQELLGNFQKLSESEQLKRYNAYQKGNGLDAVWFAQQHPAYTFLQEASFDYLMTVKGLSMTNRRALFDQLADMQDEPVAEAWSDYQMVQSELARQYALPLKQRSPRLDSLNIRFDQLERTLAFGSKAFDKAHKPITWKQVQQALAPGEAAVEFARVAQSETDHFWYVAWVLQPGDVSPRPVTLFEEKSLGNTAAVKRLYAPESGVSGLYELLWKPLQAALPNVQTIYYAPAGLLHLINPGAIPVSDQEVLADRIVLHRLVSTRQIPELKNTPDSAVSPTSALVLGGVQYEPDIKTEVVHTAVPGQTRGQSWGDNWDYLPGTLAEAQEAKQHFTKTGVKVMYGEGLMASESFFKSAIQEQPQVLHLATHGFFQSKPDSSAKHGFASAENPMARAGLILAGANRAWRGEPVPSGMEDGILTAQEISRLNLSEVQLAILSACGTGQGKIEAGEGVMGLQRALKMAGVDFVILTLWNVQDQHAREFMNLFYEAWLNQKQEVPKAFRQAQHQMRLQYSKPFQPMAWAGFILLE